MALRLISRFRDVGNVAGDSGSERQLQLAQHVRIMQVPDRDMKIRKTVQFV